MVLNGGERPLVRSFWPLPGGDGHFCESLTEFISATDGEPSWDEYSTRVRQRLPQVTSPKAARQYAGVVRQLGFLESNGVGVKATPRGRRYLRSRDQKIVRDALFENIDGMWELVDLLRAEPRRIGLLLEDMQELGFEWRTHSQIRYRLQWLREAGVVSKQGVARPVYSVTGRLPKRPK